MEYTVHNYYNSTHEGFPALGLFSYLTNQNGSILYANALYFRSSPDPHKDLIGVYVLGQVWESLHG